MTMLNTTCPFCGMVSRDGESCCTTEFKNNIIRTVQRELENLKNKLEYLRRRGVNVDNYGK